MKRGSTVHILFALLLFCIFAASLALVVMSGAGVYRDVADTLESQYSERVALDYIAARIRGYDAAGQVSIREFAGASALVLSEEADGTEYETVIYCRGGALCELYREAGEELGADAGEEIIAAVDMSFEMAADGLVRVTCTADGGRSEELLIALRSESEAA